MAARIQSVFSKSLAAVIVVLTADTQTQAAGEWAAMDWYYV